MVYGFGFRVYPQALEDLERRRVCVRLDRGKGWFINSQTRPLYAREEDATRRALTALTTPKGGQGSRFRVQGLGFTVSSSVPVYLGSRIWRARALSRSKVDEGAPHTQHVNLRIVSQPE